MEKGYLAIPADRIIPEEHKHVSKNTGNVTYEQYLVTDEDTGMTPKRLFRQSALSSQFST